MPLPFHAARLARMRAVQERAMQDTCEVLVSSSTIDPDGQPQETYAVGATLRCGVDPQPSREVMDDTQLVVADASVRLPVSAESLIKHTDRLRITQRFGEALATQPVYSIIGVPVRGPSGIVVHLRLVTE